MSKSGTDAQTPRSRQGSARERLHCYSQRTQIRAERLGALLPGDSKRLDWAGQGLFTPLCLSRTYRLTVRDLDYGLLRCG